MRGGSWLRARMRWLQDIQDALSRAGITDSVIDGGHISGTLPAHTHTHASTTGQTANDHHAQLHAASHAAGGADELDAADLASGTATAGQVPAADGAGGIAWEDQAGGISGESEATGVYVMSAFREDNAGKLYILISGDGKDWKLVGSGSRYTAESGILRDPSIIFYANKWWVCYTDDPTPIFRVISSDDLLTWTAVADVDCSSVAGSVHVWAPEWFLDDDGLHVIVSVGPDDMRSDSKLYEVHPTNAALTAWSAPAELSGIPAGTIDGYVVKVGSNYYCWHKDDSETEYNWASAAALTGAYTVDPWTPPWADTYEGVTLIKVDASTWRIYMDDFITIGTPGNGIFWAESEDDWATWTAVVKITAPYTFNHPTIYLAQGAAELSALTAYLGGGVTDHGALSGLGDDDHGQYQLRSERGSANGYAGLGASGYVPTAQLGSGSASSGTYLRGDQTWAAMQNTGEILTDENADILVDDAGNVLWGDE